MKYPITITEIPHRGKMHTWILESEEHLNSILNGSAISRSSYWDWCGENGYLVLKEMENGDWETVIDKSHELETYLDWLRHDLRELIVEENINQ